MKNMIETKNLTKTYKEFIAVDHVSLHIEKGSIYGFLGPNGAGKSTTMKILLGLTTPSALLGEPPVLILDEPTNGLDPAGIHEIRNLIKTLPKRYDCTVLISSHMLSEIELLADNIGILNHGRLLFEGSLDDLKLTAHQAGFENDNLEEMFLSMIDEDNANRKQRLKLWRI